MLEQSEADIAESRKLREMLDKPLPPRTIEIMPAKPAKPYDPVERMLFRVETGQVIEVLPGPRRTFRTELETRARLVASLNREAATRHGHRPATNIKKLRRRLRHELLPA